MHDAKRVAADPDGFDAALARRGLAPQAAAIAGLSDRRRTALGALQAQQERRKALAREIGQGRAQNADTAALETQATALRAGMEASEHQAATAEAELRVLLEALPNILDADVPDGTDETGNLTIHQIGTPRAFGFAPRQHFELGEALGLMQFEAAAKLAGARFTLLRGDLARLERALGQFMLNLHGGAHGYQEVAVPLLVNDATVYGTGQLPKFAEDLFRTSDGRWLIPTAEVPLTNLAANAILPVAELPWRLTALSDCFRSEAGAAGRDTRGMLRQHQFRKVELVSVVHPDASDAEHERMTACAEAVLKALDLPFRRMLLCAGDTGFAAAKTYDLEVWLPGQGAWREISSCSNCRDFQARRMGARYRGADGKPAGLVHTLNGSGVAVGRALIAVMENHQQEDGSIIVPEILRPYMAGQAVIGLAQM